MAADRCDRAAGDVTLVAVTKYVGQDETRALVDAGCMELGESRPQALWEKAAIGLVGARWHLIGHLQRNKVRRTLPAVTLIHSLDSRRLAESIDQEAARLGRSVGVLLEVNVSGDESKHGVRPDGLESLLSDVAALKHIDVRGLMTMAARTGGSAAARRDFAALRCLRDRLRPLCPDRVRLDDLSMGMSGDLEEAVCEGATLVRVGSALFEGP